MFGLIQRGQVIADWLQAIDDPPSCKENRKHYIQYLGKPYNATNSFFAFILPEQAYQKSQQWYGYK